MDILVFDEIIKKKLQRYYYGFSRKNYYCLKEKPLLITNHNIPIKGKAN